MWDLSDHTFSLFSFKRCHSFVSPLSISLSPLCVALTHISLSISLSPTSCLQTPTPFLSSHFLFLSPSNLHADIMYLSVSSHAPWSTVSTHEVFIRGQNRLSVSMSVNKKHPSEHTYKQEHALKPVHIGNDLTFKMEQIYRRVNSNRDNLMELLFKTLPNSKLFYSHVCN